MHVDRLELAFIEPRERSQTDDQRLHPVQTLLHVGKPRTHLVQTVQNLLGRVIP
jgi:hypothetical protein